MTSFDPQAVIIGAGRVGATLGRMLKSCGISTAALTCRSENKAAQAADFIGEGSAICFQGKEISAELTSVLSGLSAPAFVFITVSDDSIESAAEVLSNCRKNWTGISVLHCSGGLSADVLGAFSERGAATAALHPCYPIFKACDALPRDRGLVYTFSGDSSLAPICESWVSAWGGVWCNVGSITREAYHAGGVFCAGHLAALLSAGVEAFEAAGLDSKQAIQIALSISSGVLENLRANNSDNPLAEILTGPFVRGDEELIGAHRQVLKEKAPDLLGLYDLLGDRSRRILKPTR